MPASKRRLAEARAAQRAREAQGLDAGDIAAQLGGVSAATSASAAADTSSRDVPATVATASAGASADPGSTAKPARPARQRYVETDPAYMPWPRAALMALLASVFALQLLFGLGQHFIWHRDRLIWVDLFFPNSVLLLGGTVVLAPIIKTLLHLPRHLRWLESLSLGAVYALFVTLLSLTLIHTPVLPKTATSDDILNALGNSDVPGLVIADTFGILFGAQLFPGLSRLITAPGRRAKARLEEKQRLAKKGGGQAARGTSRGTPARGRTTASRGSSPKGRG